jgi:NAD(P)H-dependent FMN reductase
MGDQSNNKCEKLKQMKLTISLLYGSVRTARKGIMAARFLEQKLKERNIIVNFIDPMQYQLPFLDKMYKEFEAGMAPYPMEKLAGIFKGSDAFLIVTGEYNNSIPPVLKNMLDHFQTEYYFKPSAIASYSSGSFGGVRAAVQLRIILAELGMPSISTILPFPIIGNFFDEDLVPKNEKVLASTKRFLDEFIWYVEAFKNQRDKGVPY